MEHPVLETGSSFNWCPRDPHISEDSKGPGTTQTNERQHLGPLDPQSGLFSPCQQEGTEEEVGPEGLGAGATMVNLH